MVEAPNVAVTSELLKDSLDRLARKGRILVDPRPEPDLESWLPATENDDLKLVRRAESDPFSNQDSTSNAKSTSSSSTTKSSSATKTASSTGITAATQNALSSMPQPFDQGFDGNITESCTNFMYGFLTNSTFKACLPFSLLLYNSDSFFQASKSAFEVTQLLDTTCSADLTVCEPLMASLATNISASANCGSDLTNENPKIQNAQIGLKAYKTLYSASCLRNPQTSAYCFADAVTNSSSPSDSYIYYLPLNTTLPGGRQPTCNSCLKSTMAIFSAATSDRSSSIANTYVAAAQQINIQCGPGFVNASLAAAVQSGASSYTVPSGLASSNIGLIALVMLVGSWLL
ncbi:hypothetical protein B0O99DRAFT_511562 [Bisporella sp. PMI_857]|nr:hypothetical protein B0O99DRAFT_511562 [Bisporella sp. PMI_857]